ncbi:MAG: sensor histidine kinase [Acidimicrobiales bacterium]
MMGWRELGVVVAGLVFSGGVAAAAALPARDGLSLVALSFGVALISYLVGVRALRMARRRIGIGAAAAIVAAIPVVAVAAGTLVAANAMFVSRHDLAALSVVVVGAGTAGALGAVAWAAELAAARRDADAARERERWLERSRRELVAWVSHDLRTPLAGVRAMAEALEDEVVTDEATVLRYHRQIGLEVDRLTRLVDDLFELARLQADAVALTLERVALGDVVSDAVASVAAVADAKGVRVSGAVTADQPTVAASSRELTRVVYNLIDNAIRHTPPGGSVAVEVSEHDGVALVSVSDECGGIADGAIERVFEPAYRGDVARTPGGGGGLGLAIARGLVEAHAGDIAVVNDNGGCRFTVRLPLA